MKTHSFFPTISSVAVILACLLTGCYYETYPVYGGYTRPNPYYAPVRTTYYSNTVTPYYSGYGYNSYNAVSPITYPLHPQPPAYVPPIGRGYARPPVYVSPPSWGRGYRR